MNAGTEGNEAGNDAELTRACEAVPGHSDNQYLPESIAAQIFGCHGGNNYIGEGDREHEHWQGQDGGNPADCPPMDGMFTYCHGCSEDHTKPCAVIDGGYCREADPMYTSTSERQLYGICSFAVGPGSCPSSCWTGASADVSGIWTPATAATEGQCPNTCEHCDDDAIMGHGGANVWVHETGGRHRRLAKDSTAPGPEASAEPTTEKQTKEDAMDTSSSVRQLQSGFGSLGGFSLPVTSACSMAGLQDRLDEVNTMCCNEDNPCTDGLPSGCGIQCGMVYTKFYAECYHLMMGVIGVSDNPEASAVFDDFEQTCVSTFDPRSLLDVISSAQCCKLQNIPCI